MNAKNSTADMIVDAMIRLGIPLTVENWMSLNYWDRTLGFARRRRAGGSFEAGGEAS